MIDEADLLLGICADPADDVPRLAYADELDRMPGVVECLTCRPYRQGAAGTTAGAWTLSELAAKCTRCDGTGTISDGRAERAEFIRVQCELVRCSVCNTIGGPSWDWSCGHKNTRRRERELFARHCDQWFHDVKCFNHTEISFSPATGVWYDIRRGFVASITLPLATLLGGECDRCGGEPVCDICDGSNQVNHPNGGVNLCPNGFDHEDDRQIGCRPKCPDCDGTGQTEGIARDLFSRHPITEVRFSDREPDMDERAFWHGDYDGNIQGVRDRAGLPPQIYNLMTDWDESEQHDGFRWKVYPSRQLAFAALSAAAVNYCRWLVGLKPLRRTT